MELVINGNLDLQRKIYSEFKQFFEEDKPNCSVISIDNVVRGFSKNYHTEIISAEIYVDSRKAGYLKYFLTDDKYEETPFSKRVIIDKNFYSTMPKRGQTDNSRIIFEY